MILRFKQRLFSWLDSYDIFDEDGNTAYTVKGELAWGHRLKIFDPCDNELATLQQRVFTFLPTFDMYLGEQLIGSIKKEFSFFTPQYHIDCNGWYIEGDFFEWDYSIFTATGERVATVSKELFEWTDTYTLDIREPRDALTVLLFVLAVDAEKCSRD